jgi:3-isopropylmalate dehydrogenase (EC 1.1.1.85)
VYRIGVITGDGIGPEIIAEGRKVLDAASERYGFELDWQYVDLGAERYLRTGELITEEDLDDLSHCRAIYFGAIGDERVKPGILEKGILLALRFHFDQYIICAR